MTLTRTKIAAAGTAAALGTLGVVALSAGAQEQAKPAAAPQAQAAQVRTVVVHRTVRVVKHQRRKGRHHTATHAATTTPTTTAPTAVAPTPAPATTAAPATTTHREQEAAQGDDHGQGIEPGDDRGQEAEPGDDRGGREAEAGDDRGHNDTQDDNSGHDDSGSHGNDDN